MRSLLLLLVAGCWTSTPPAAPPPTVAPTSPAPTVAWNDNWIEGTRLPAVSRDGMTIVLGVRESDGARGAPNFHLERYDRTDTVREKLGVLAIDEVDTAGMFGDTGPTAKLRERISRANDWLAHLHRGADLVPLREASGGEITLADRLVIRRGGKVLADRAVPAAWTAVAPRSAAGIECENTPYLGTSWLDGDRQVAVIAIDFTGSDMCWEPGTRYHVVAW